MKVLPWFIYNMAQINKFYIVVIGSEASGLSAALRAQHLGGRMLLIEKASVTGGATAMPGGCIWVPNHHHQGKLGVEDLSKDAIAFGLLTTIYLTQSKFVSRVWSPCIPSSHHAHN